MIKQTQHFELNTKGRDFFVGDIHGMYNEFMQMLEEINFDREVDRMFSVGDLVDRGPKSAECLSLLVESWFHAVIGNHEEFVITPCSYGTWMCNGGMWINRYTVEDHQAFEAMIREYMSYSLTVETARGLIGLVHADTFKDFSLNGIDSTRIANVWGRARISSNDTSIVKGVDRVVVGHTPLKQVKKLGNVVFIDTGACFSNGYFTVLSVDEVFDF